MENNSRPSIEEIVRKWKNTNGTRRVSETGTSYVIIKTSSDNLEMLADTMYQNGFTYQDMNQPNTARIITDICWRDDKIRKLSSTEINKAKYALAKDWFECITKYSNVVLAQPKIIEVKPEKTPEIDPKDRIKMDSSDIEDPEDDLEFLEELGVVDGKET